MSEAPRSMEPAAAAEVLRGALKDPTRPFTVADASAASGLALRDVESGLHHLTSEYRGHLRVTEDGDLVHVFPHGFTKPWETRDRISRALSAMKNALFGVGRFVVRAWILIVMIAYVAIFVAILVGMAFAGGSRDRGGRGGLGLLSVLLRGIVDALFWTFHPFSPLYVDAPYSYGLPTRAPARARRRDDVPFYEKVNRFVFGPREKAIDPHAARAKILAEIRAQKGRIGLADVMRVTGLPRDEADPLMARLMLDHDGSVEVGEQGGIVYRFESMRRTADADHAVEAPRPRAAWESPRALAPLTGNETGTNVGIGFLNAFNLGMGAFALGNGLTISNVMLLFSKHPPHVMPDGGTAIALGLVPLVFSILVFLMPIGRALLRGAERRKVNDENARLAVLREVLARAPKKETVDDESLRRAVRVATGTEPTSKEITRRVVELGGDVDTGPNGEVRYRFADLEAEAAALEEERERASEAEARLGKVVFASDE